MIEYLNCNASNPALNVLHGSGIGCEILSELALYGENSHKHGAFFWHQENKLFLSMRNFFLRLSGDIIDTEELIRGAVEHVAPDLVVAIDALAARSAERLMTTVQLCDTGIAPGSGMGNHRCRLDRETLGVPVIAIGVPTVVNSATLNRDALEVGGIKEISLGLEKLLEGGRSFFVSPKESDLAVRELASIIAGALNSAFGSDALA